MLKKFLCFPIFCFLFLSGINAQNKSLSNIPTFIPTKNFSYNIKTTDNFIFNGSVTPTIDLIVKNNRLDPMPYKISCTIQTEDGVNYYSLTQSSTINSLDSTLLSFNFYAPNPGFYKVKLQTQDELIGEFNICYEPSKVDYKYYYDKGADFFWQLLRKKNQYKDADYKVIKLRDSRVRPRETYQVDM